MITRLPDWTSLAERYPTADDAYKNRVLVYDKSGMIFVLPVDMIIGWNRSSYDDGTKFSPVTHWTRAPEPPEPPEENRNRRADRCGAERNGHGDRPGKWPW